MFFLPFFAEAKRRREYNTNLTREARSFTSERSERLHKRPKGATSQARLHRDFSEDVKKSLWLLSEVVLRTVK